MPRLLYLLLLLLYLPSQLLLMIHYLPSQLLLLLLPPTSHRQLWLKYVLFYLHLLTDRDSSVMVFSLVVKYVDR